MAAVETCMGANSLRGTAVAEEKTTDAAPAQNEGNEVDGVEGEELTPVSPSIFKSEVQTEAFLYGTGKPMDRVQSVVKRESLTKVVDLDGNVLLWKTRRQSVRSVLLSNSVQGFLIFFLFIALFLYDIWILVSVPSEHDMVLFVIICLTFVIFTVEVFLQCWVIKDYTCNFFFWMDVLGTLSLVFDLVQLLQESLLPQNSAGTTADNSVLFRTARVSKVREGKQRKR